MKTTIFRRKALAFFGAAAILLAAVFTIGCKTDTGSGAPAPETFTVEMKAGEHGTVTANPVIPANGKVAKDTVITFSAAPASGYKVDKWTITGGTFETGTGTEGSTTAKVKITADTKVNVSFKSETITPPSPTEFTVEMTHGEHGTVTANPAIPAGGKVAKDTVITFTATPASGYKVDKWTITVGAFEAGTGTEGSTTAKVKISANTKVNVSFKSETITPPSPTEFTVEMTHGEHGTVTANPAIPAGGKVAKDTVITFTAAPASGYKVDKWTITGGTFETGTGTDGSTTAKVKISADTKVNVSFKTIVYTSVSFTNLNAYLNGTASSADINYIKVTGLTAADLKGDSVSRSPSPLGKILKDNPTKKVALKLSEVSGLTDMSYCFYGCTSLIQAPAIPSGVTNMSWCFYGCTSLTQAPVIPSGVTDMSSCFSGCRSLTQAPVIPSGVTNMIWCFSGCESLTQAPVIPSGVTNMLSCFENCKRLIQAPEIPSTVTNMRSCFENCKSLTQAPAIPSGVTDMSNCFKNCESLTQAPAIPSGVTNMRLCFYGCEKITAVTLKCNYVEGKFDRAFGGCKALTANSIKVPAGQLQTYKDNADTMDAQENWFVAGE